MANEPDIWTMRWWLQSQVATDVTDRFYHRLTAQNEFALLEPKNTQAELWAAIIDAVCEVLIDRSKMSDSEADRFVVKVTDAWVSSPYHKAAEEHDILRDAKKAVQFIQPVCTLAVQELSDAQVKKTEVENVPSPLDSGAVTQACGYIGISIPS